MMSARAIVLPPKSDSSLSASQVLRQCRQRPGLHPRAARDRRERDALKHGDRHVRQQDELEHRQPDQSAEAELLVEQ